MKKTLDHLHFIVPLFLYSIFAFKDMYLPGLYMDAVNPDYQAVWITRGLQTIPAWIYPDNYLFGPYRFPLLNSLYGGNLSTYLGMLFFKITGFGIVELRIFHITVGAILLIALAWSLMQWKVKKHWIAICLALCAVDPNFIFAWRTQYYLQLIPIIFFSIGIGFLGIHYYLSGSEKKNKRLLFYAGMLCGFAAYLYFIFAFYAAALVLAYTYIAHKKANSVKELIPLFFGVVIGWLPFLYAHVSILLNSGFTAYLNQLHSLQTTYGVVDANQGEFLERFKIVWDRLKLLPAAEGMQKNIFGQIDSQVRFSSFGIFLLLLGPLLCLVSIGFDKFRDGQAEQVREKISYNVLIILLWSVVISHVIVGVLVGRPLGLQHYIMLLPVTYMMLTVASSALIFQVWMSENVRQLYSIALILMLLLNLTFNVASVLQFRERIQTTGGNGMYSDVINVAAVNLRNVPRDTALLFPQWGYWMAVVIALGPTHSIYETPTLAQMQQRLKSDPELAQKRNFVLAVGATSTADEEDNVAKNIIAFAESAQLKIGQTIKCIGRNGIDQIWLIEMSRSS